MIKIVKTKDLVKGEKYLFKWKLNLSFSHYHSELGYPMFESTKYSRKKFTTIENYHPMDFDTFIKKS